MLLFSKIPDLHTRSLLAAENKLWGPFAHQCSKASALSLRLCQLSRMKVMAIFIWGLKVSKALSHTEPHLIFTTTWLGGLGKHNYLYYPKGACRG